MDNDSPVLWIEARSFPSTGQFSETSQEFHRLHNDSRQATSGTAAFSPIDMHDMRILDLTMARFLKDTTNPSH